MRVAIVTGSNKGIGLAIVRGLCRQFEGDVYLTSRDRDRGEKAVKLLQEEGLSPKYHQLDITSEDSVASLRAFMLGKYGGVDVLVNNAGIAYKHASTASALEQASNTVATNFTGLLNMLRSFIPVIHPHGRVVNVSSYHPGLLDRLTNQELRDRFTKPTLTEEQVLELKEEFLEDVKQGVHRDKGWCNTLYSSSKVLEVSLMAVYNKNLQESGVCDGSSSDVCLYSYTSKVGQSWTIFNS